MAFYLGIDSGGSKTTSAVGDETSLLATATAGPSNVVRVGEVQARESLHQSVRLACAAAGITPVQIARTCIGAAGAIRSDVVSAVRGALAEILFTSIEVVGDMEIALDAAFHDGPGIIVIAGTGSIAYGRDARGNVVRAGGWGFAISDEGSAYWIGRAAVTAVLRAIDSPEQDRDGHSREVAPPLLGYLQKAWNVTSLDEFLRAANSTPPPNFAALFPALLTAAQVPVNDPLAQQILTLAGQELAHLAAIVIRRLGSAAIAPDPFQARLPESQNVNPPVRLAMVGGVFGHASLVREVFYHEIRALHPVAEINPQIIDPVDGALRLARRGFSGHRMPSQSSH